MRTAGDILVVMAKRPEPGQVKTRLAQAVGEAAACDLYRAFLADLARRFSVGPWRLVWAVSPPGSRLDELVGAGAEHLDQRGDGLAARMHACFTDLFAARAGRVVMIGADAPQVSEATVGGAFAALDGVDVVLAPTPDGGYCLVGLTAPRDLFAGVAMGSARVLSQTRAICARRGYTVRELPGQFDVDEVADIARLEREIAGRSDLEATASVLAGWRRRGVLGTQ